MIHDKQQVTKHRLKTWPEYFVAVIEDKKPFELRKNDRNYKVNDILVLEEYDPVKQEYTGRSLNQMITYVCTNTEFGLKEGYCVLGLGDMNFDTIS